MLAAVGQRELAWPENFGERRFPREPLYREFYGREMVDPQTQINNLSDYLKTAQQIVPKDEDLNEPILRHADLSPNNVFVSESGEITGVIDRQHCVILPIFLQAKIPKHFQNYGDEDSENFQPPRLPENFDALPEIEKDKEVELYRRRQLHHFYLGFTSRNNKSHFHTIGTYDLVVRNRLYNAAGQPWEGDNVSSKVELVQSSAYWPLIADLANDDTESPIKYSEEDVEECLEIDAKQNKADEQMQKMRDHFGINIDGWILNDLYEDAKQKERDIKK